ncbi:hypothetical protein [Accumulibacter sp.]|jgi:hypothetical protein|uniref:hypothetical protein n=1 Tax=Accumulibacter sp. TaxID=2053492 RepID=UPI001ACC1427|nr:hypothetical protein [Accumulibacter sp.]MBN8453659.1 hypothetical protein [Accumulibacter sp.]
MWILLFLITFWGVLAFVTNHKHQSLVIITLLGTGGLQLVPIHWFWSPLLLVKPYDYAFAAMGAIFLLRAKDLRQVLTRERVARLAAVYMSFLALVLVASIGAFSYSLIQAVQSARVFFWPAFLLLFLLVDRTALQRFVKLLFPIVLTLSVLYLLQPITGKTIINPSGEYYNPYIGSTDMKRYLSTPDFLIFFLLLAYHRICSCEGKSLGFRLGQWLAFLVFSSVQVVSLTRSVILGTGAALLYLSKRLVNPVLVVFVLSATVIAVAVAYSTSTTIEQRVDDSLKDISATLDGRFLGRDAAKDGNLSFRIAHISERLTYVLDSAKRWPIGIGFIHEDSAAAQSLGFKHGLPNLLTGRVVQVDTGDVAWSVVIIKTGLAGLGLLLAFLVGSFRALGNTRDVYAVTYRGALLYFLITSFFSSNLISPNAMLPLMLFLAMAVRTREAAAPVCQEAAHQARSVRDTSVPAGIAVGKLTQPPISTRQGQA